MHSAIYCDLQQKSVTINLLNTTHINIVVFLTTNNKKNLVFNRCIKKLKIQFNLLIEKIIKECPDVVDFQSISRIVFPTLLDQRRPISRWFTLQ